MTYLGCVFGSQKKEAVTFKVLDPNAPSKWRGRCVTAGKGALYLGLAGLVTLGVLGLLQSSSHLSLPNSFSWLSTGLHTVGQDAIFGTMIGVGVGVPLAMLIKNRYDARKLAQKMTYPKI